MKRITTTLIAAGLSAILATPVLADGHIMDLGASCSGMHIDIGLITADAPGMVTIYDYRTGERGEMFGSAPINAGANADVRVPLNCSPKDDVLAVLTDEGGNEVAMSVIDID